MEQSGHDHFTFSPPFSYRTRSAKYMVYIRLTRAAGHSRMLFLRKVVSALDAVLVSDFVILAVNIHDLFEIYFQFVTHGYLLSRAGRCLI